MQWVICAYMTETDQVSWGEYSLAMPTVEGGNVRIHYGGEEKNKRLDYDKKFLLTIIKHPIFYFVIFIFISCSVSKNHLVVHVFGDHSLQRFWLVDEVRALIIYIKNFNLFCNNRFDTWTKKKKKKNYFQFLKKMKQKQKILKMK